MMKVVMVIVGDVRGASLTIDRHGKSNSAYSFDGIDDYIYIKHDESLNVVGSYSFSFWVNREINGTKYVLGKVETAEIVIGFIRGARF